MFIEDLSTAPRGPSLANIWARELERDYPGLVTRSVGWLGATVPTSGPVDSLILAALRHYASWARVEDGWMGVHTCEICHSFSSNGEFWIIWLGTRYVLPQMALHYIAEHGYKPPDQFLQHVREKWTTEGVLDRVPLRDSGTAAEAPCQQELKTASAQGLVAVLVSGGPTCA